MYNLCRNCVCIKHEKQNMIINKKLRKLLNFLIWASKHIFSLCLVCAWIPCNDNKLDLFFFRKFCCHAFNTQHTYISTKLTPLLRIIPTIICYKSQTFSSQYCIIQCYKTKQRKTKLFDKDLFLVP